MAFGSNDRRRTETDRRGKEPIAWNRLYDKVKRSCVRTSQGRLHSQFSIIKSHKGDRREVRGIDQKFTPIREVAMLRTITPLSAPNRKWSRDPFRLYSNCLRGLPWSTLTLLSATTTILGVIISKQNSEEDGIGDRKMRKLSHGTSK